MVDHVNDSLYDIIVKVADLGGRCLVPEGSMDATFDMQAIELGIRFGHLKWTSDYGLGAFEGISITAQGRAAVGLPSASIFGLFKEWIRPTQTSTRPVSPASEVAFG